MFQKIIIGGNLGRNPETQYLPSGDAVCKFSVATNRRWTGANGQQEEETIWWNVSAWGRTGENCQAYLEKGQYVIVEGTLTVDKGTGAPRIWTDQSGQARVSLDLRASDVRFGPKSGGDRDSGYGQPARAQAQPQVRPAAQQQQQQARPAQTNQRPTSSRPTQQADRLDPDEMLGGPPAAAVEAPDFDW